MYYMQYLPRQIGQGSEAISFFLRLDDIYTRILLELEASVAAVSSARTVIHNAFHKHHSVDTIVVVATRSTDIILARIEFALAWHRLGCNRPSGGGANIDTLCDCLVSVHGFCRGRRQFKSGRRILGRI